MEKNYTNIQFKTSYIYPSIYYSSLFLGGSSGRVIAAYASGSICVLFVFYKR